MSVKGAIKNPVCECGLVKDFRRTCTYGVYMTCRTCYYKQQYRRIRERKTKICEIHGEAKAQLPGGWFRCMHCKRDRENKNTENERLVRKNDTLNNIQGPLRPPKKYPDDLMWLRALAIRLEGLEARRGLYRSVTREKVRA